MLVFYLGDKCIPTKITVKRKIKNLSESSGGLRAISGIARRKKRKLALSRMS